MTPETCTKKWYKSKTLWINIIALIAILAQTQYEFIIHPEEQAALLTIINLALRMITNTELEITKTG